MRMVKVISVIVGLLFVGCGGGGSSTSSSVEYDMWEYIASKDTTTNTFDRYNSNSTYTLVEDKTIDAGYIEYTILASNVKRADFNGENIVTFTLNGDSIKLNDNIYIERYKSIGSKIGECTLESHHDTLTIANSYVFSDVLEFNCTDYKEFYSKNRGLIATYGKDIYDDGRTIRTYYFVSVVNN